MPWPPHLPSPISWHSACATGDVGTLTLSCKLLGVDGMHAMTCGAARKLPFAATARVSGPAMRRTQEEYPVDSVSFIRGFQAQAQAQAPTFLLC